MSIPSPRVAARRPRAAAVGVLALLASGLSLAPNARAETAPACLTGNVTWTDAEGAAHPASFWKAELLDAGTGAVLDSGYVSPQGGYRLCGSTGDAGTRQVKVKVGADGEHWSVRWTFAAATSLSSTVTLGGADPVPLDVALPSGRTFGGLAEIFDDLRRAWEAVPGPCWDQEGTCDKITVVWDPTGQVHPHYDLDTKVITVGADAYRPPHVLVHEAMHAIMDDAYDHDFPPHLCSVVLNGQTYTGVHGPGARTNTGCAWVEGIADWFAATVMGDATMRFGQTGGDSVEDLPYLEHGDSVEGWVTGALHDLADSANEDGDLVAEGMGPTWTVVQEARPRTFAEYWKARGDLGFDTSFRVWQTLRHDTIEYPKPACEATLGTVNTWGTPRTNWFATVTVRAGDAPLTGWTVRTRLPAGAQPYSGYGLDYRTSGAVTTLTGVAGAGPIAAGTTRDVVLQGIGPAPTGIPFSCTSS